MDSPAKENNQSIETEVKEDAASPSKGIPSATLMFYLPIRHRRVAEVSKRREKTCNGNES
jgi:hypothetical protein